MENCSNIAIKAFYCGIKMTQKEKLKIITNVKLFTAAAGTEAASFGLLGICNVLEIMFKK